MASETPAPASILGVRDKSSSVKRRFTVSDFRPLLLIPLLVMPVGFLLGYALGALVSWF